MHWLVAGYFGFKGQRERARILRGPAADEMNRQGAEALMAFMDAAGAALRH